MSEVIPTPLEAPVETVILNYPDGSLKARFTKQGKKLEGKFELFHPVTPTVKEGTKFLKTFFFRGRIYNKYKIYNERGVRLNTCNNDGNMFVRKYNSDSGVLIGIIRYNYTKMVMFPIEVYNPQEYALIYLFISFDVNLYIKMLDDKYNNLYPCLKEIEETKEEAGETQEQVVSVETLEETQRTNDEEGTQGVNDEETQDKTEVMKPKRKKKRHTRRRKTIPVLEAEPEDEDVPILIPINDDLDTPDLKGEVDIPDLKEETLVEKPGTQEPQINTLLLSPVKRKKVSL